MERDRSGMRAWLTAVTALALAAASAGAAEKGVLPGVGAPAAASHP